MKDMDKKKDAAYGLENDFLRVPADADPSPEGDSPDPDEYDEIYTLHDNVRNEDTDFLLVYETELDGKTYVFLTPDRPCEDISDDEALIFRTDEKDGEETLTAVTDENLLDRLYAVYLEDYNAGSGD